MRRRPAALLLALALATGLTACGGESTQVTDEGVVETPSGGPGGAEPGAGLDAPSGDPLDAPSPS
ncbi:MAG: hypothetical protein JWO60_1753 [Frankiales bacterium]|nr:hypothetical protein [Frankiales bacterium]